MEQTTAGCGGSRIGNTVSETSSHGQPMKGGHWVRASSFLSKETRVCQNISVDLGQAAGGRGKNEMF